MSDAYTKRRGRKPGQLVRMKCSACGIETMGRGATKHSRCDSCREAGRRGVLLGSKRDNIGGARAMAAVSAAIQDGFLARPATCVCVDCGAQAQQYDHRDYRRPLEVEPVCRSCNKLRGPAIPLDGSIEQRVLDGVIPYCFRATTEKLFKTMGLPVDVLVGMPKKLTLNHWETLLPIIRGATHATKEPSHA